MSSLETFTRSFGGGEISPLLRARVDDASVQTGLKLVRNMVIQPQGPAQRRPGLEHVAFSKLSNKKARLIPFRFSTTQALVAQLGEQHIRFYAEGRPFVQASGVLVSVVDPVGIEILRFAGEHGFAHDDRVRVIALGPGSAQPGGVSALTEYFVRFIDPRSFQLSLTAGGAAIDITSTGTGPIYAFVASTVPKTYAAPKDPSSVDAALETITFVSDHFLETGDEIVFVGSDVITMGLVALTTTYFAIRVDSVTIKVATTLANALALVAFNILGAPGPNVRMRRKYAAGDLVYLSTTGNGFFYCIQNPAADPTPAVDNTPPAATAFWYEMPDDGTFELPSPYIESNLPQIKYDQKFDTLGLAHDDHQLRDLIRFGATDWVLSTATFAPTLPAPVQVFAIPARGAGISCRSITAATPAVIVTGSFTAATDVEHGLSTGEVVLFNGSPGDLGSITPNLLYRVQRVDAIRIILVDASTGVVIGSSNAVVTANARLFATSLAAENTQTYVVTAIDSEGNESPASPPVTVTNNLFVSGASNALSWATVPGAVRYRVYKQLNGLFGFRGETEELAFLDDDTDPDLKVQVPIRDTAFDGSDFPGVIGRFDQRRVLAATDLFPQGCWMTKPGTDKDLSFSIPVVDSDRIKFEVDSSGELTQIRHIVGVNHLMLMTSDGEYRVTPLNSDVITPESVSVRRQSGVGCSHVRPIVANNQILFAADRGGHIFEIGFRQEGSGFKPDDLCLRAAHLFDGFTLTDSAYMKAPYPLIFMPSSEGRMLTMTYVPEQNVQPWWRIETDGEIESVCVIPEGLEDRAYVAVKRTVNGSTVRSVERMGTLTQAATNKLEDAFFVDAGVTFDGRNTTAVTVHAINGRSWANDESLTLLAGLPTFQVGTADVGDQVVLIAADGTKNRLTIESVVSTTEARVRTDIPLATEFRNIPTTSWAFARDTFTGVGHLEGVTVQILAEGVVLPTQTVTGGALTLSSPRYLVHFGRQCTARLETMPLVLNVEGLGKGRSLNPSRTVANVFQSAPFRMGPDDGTLVTVGGVALADGLATLDVEEVLKGKWTAGGELVIEQSDPLPLTIVGFSLDVAVGGQP